MLLTFALIAGASLFAARTLQAQAAVRSAQLLANSLAPTLVFEDKAAAITEVSILSKTSEVRAIRVLNASAMPFVQWPLEEVGAWPAVPAELAGADVFKRRHLKDVEVWVAIKLKGERVGSLYMKESLQAVQLAVLRMVALSALLVALAIWQAGRLLRWVQRRALAPIVELSVLAEQVALSQDYSRRAQVHGPDEVGRLSERFNQMLERVEIGQAELNQRVRLEQQAGQQFEQLAHRDSLTQLPNRLFFQSTLQRHVLQSCQQADLMALMFIDLDNFKAVNDQHGHEVGDAVLREVASRMSKVLRNADVLCRLGGDEFALILPALPNEAVAEQLAQRLIAAVQEPMMMGGHLMPVGATIGLAFCPTEEMDAPHLLRAADAAMYAAKRAGKNTFRRAAHAAQ
nr:sensor domain-containing diguanylate cyclase [Roseateles oligotrophus]